MTKMFNVDIYLKKNQQGFFINALDIMYDIHHILLFKTI